MPTIRSQSDIRKNPTQLRWRLHEDGEALAGIVEHVDEADDVPMTQAPEELDLLLRIRASADLHAGKLRQDTRKQFWKIYVRTRLSRGKQLYRSWRGWPSHLRGRRRQTGSVETQSHGMLAIYCLWPSSWLCDQALPHVRTWELTPHLWGAHLLRDHQAVVGGAEQHGAPKAAIPGLDRISLRQFFCATQMEKNAASSDLR